MNINDRGNIKHLFGIALLSALRDSNSKWKRIGIHIVGVLLIILLFCKCILLTIYLLLFPTFMFAYNVMTLNSYCFYLWYISFSCLLLFLLIIHFIFNFYFFSIRFNCDMLLFLSLSTFIVVFFFSREVTILSLEIILLHFLGSPERVYIIPWQQNKHSPSFTTTQHTPERRQSYRNCIKSYKARLKERNIKINEGKLR